MYLGVCDYRRNMDWLVDLLMTCIHHSELQVITALLLVSTLSILSLRSLVVAL
jgi:hypothetical protein